VTALVINECRCVFVQTRANFIPYAEIGSKRIDENHNGLFAFHPLKIIMNNDVVYGRELHGFLLSSSTVVL
jgi:hypothetical protein